MKELTRGLLKEAFIATFHNFTGKKWDQPTAQDMADQTSRRIYDLTRRKIEVELSFYPQRDFLEVKFDSGVDIYSIDISFQQNKSN